MSDSKVVCCTRGMVPRLVGLSTQLALLPSHCVVHMIMSFIIDLGLIDLLQLILWGASNCLLFLVTLNPCTNTSICLQIQFLTRINGQIIIIRRCRFQGGHFFFATYGISCSLGALHKIMSAINWGTNMLAATRSPMSPRESHVLCGTHCIQFANGQTHETYS